LKIYDLIF
jgi:hypothetical protein